MDPIPLPMMETFPQRRLRLLREILGAEMPTLGNGSPDYAHIPASIIQLSMLGAIGEMLDGVLRQTVV